MRSLSIALLGTRGIPARYGGFETFAEEVSSRLAARGHQMTVYGRYYLGQPDPVTVEEIGGVKVVRTPTLPTKYLDTPLASLTAFIHLRCTAKRPDVVLLCNAANSIWGWLAPAPLLINVDGIERKRRKWGLLGKLGYRLGEWCSVRFGTRVVSDAEVIREYYERAFGITSPVITYGCDPRPLPPGEVHARYGLTPGKFLLYVSRFEPENNALVVVEANRRVKSDWPLVMVGDAPYASVYKEVVRSAADARVIFTGFQFGDAYRELRSNCGGYIQATEVGGTHPALVEAMAYGNAIIANDVPEHREVLGRCGWYYPRNDVAGLAAVIEELLRSAEQRRALGEAAAARARERYSWDSIVDQYERLFLEVVTR